MCFAFFNVSAVIVFAGEVGKAAGEGRKKQHDEISGYRRIVNVGR